MVEVSSETQSFEADISEAHINTIKLSQTPSIKKVCLYFGDSFRFIYPIW